MQSFFSKLKSKFKADYGGRYLSVVLGEIINQAPEIADFLWNKKMSLKKGEFIVDDEHRYDNSRRRADLAILDSKLVLQAVLEIKYEDHKADKNKEQLENYIKYIKKEKIPFTYLTKYKPPLELYKVAKDYHMTYAQLAKSIDGLKASYPVIQMLFDHLREEGYMYEENIDQDAMKLLIIKSTSFPHSAGQGRRLNKFERIAVEVPSTFSAILKNATVISNRFFDDDMEDILKKRPTVDFGFTSYLKNCDRLTKQIEQNDNLIPVDKKAQIVSKGDFWAGAQAKFYSNGSDFLTLKFGFIFSYIEGGEIESQVYATICKHLKDFATSKIQKDLFKTSEDKVYSMIIRTMIKSIDKLLTNKSSDINKGSSRSRVGHFISL